MDTKSVDEILELEDMDKSVVIAVGKGCVWRYKRAQG